MNKEVAAELHKSLAKRAIGTLIVTYAGLTGHTKQVVGKMLNSLDTMDLVKMGMSIKFAPYAKRLRKPV